MGIFKHIKNKKDKKDKKVGKNLSYWEKQKITKPTEGKTNNTLSVVLFSQKVLDEIATECLPNAGSSEFQVHYRGLQIKIYDPERKNRLVFTIPTVFFNMPQLVSTASVAFNFDEIASISNDIIPISDEIAKAAKKAFPTKYFKDKGFTVVFEEYEMGSLHRHPGNFGFSPTDLDNQVEDPGIIFRTLEAEDKVQVDSVMYIPGQNVQLVTTESRIVNVKPAKDGGIEGSYLHTPTVSYIIQDTVTVPVGFQNFFDEAKEQPVEKFTQFTVDSDRLDIDIPEIDKVLDIMLQSMDYKPAQFISGELIEQELAFSYTRKTPKYEGGTSSNCLAYDDDWKNESWYNSGWDDDDESDQMIYPQPEEPVVIKPLSVRPSWRKNQTVNRLKTIYKVKIEDEPGITGDASEKDIIAIAQILKLRKIEDQEIRRFFRDMDYPFDALETFYKDLT